MREVRVDFDHGYEPVRSYDGRPLYHQQVRADDVTITLLGLNRTESVEVIRRLQGLPGMPALPEAERKIEQALSRDFPRRLDV